MTDLSDTPDDLMQPHPGFLIVGLGASAGGVEALRDFFTQVPADSGVAYVVILHMSPEYESQLANVLQTVTPLTVTQVTETVRVVPNRVYVVSPNQHLTMVDGELTVSANTLPEERRAPIDIFFRTLADTHHNRAVCVVLSGTGADGSMGLKRVKERGGVVFVQNPREAAFNEMPRSAIATDLVDDVLPVAAMPARIMAYQASLGTIAIPVEADQRPEEQQQALREIFTQLRVRTGHDFSNYKRPTLLRRIARRINVRELPDLPAYAAFLRDNPDEVQALLKDLLISVTNFFRDKQAFAELEQEVIPRLFQGRPAEEQVRIWVVGCATGEEAYSVAMLCAERVLGALEAPNVQIFATDIDEAAIAHAREGLYTVNDTADVSPERLRRFFTLEDHRYRIRREIREMVLFANHNVLKDPPFSHLDLVTCRNLLIYLNHTAQERVLETLHFALNPGGYLFLGTSESVDGSNDLFSIVSREQHIYQSRATAARSVPLPDVGSLGRNPARLLVPLPVPEERSRDRINYDDLHQRLLEEYAPPSVVVNEDYTVVRLSERAGRYMQVAGKEVSNNLLQLIRTELRLELRSALYQALQRQTNVQTGPLPIRINDHVETVIIHIRPVLRQSDPAQGFLLVVFEQSTASPGDSEPVTRADEPVALQLEDEVHNLKQQLRTSSEQYEFQAEELKATNEELQALNEELRSSTEELETSKEELQSINEELRTVNQELKVKVEEVTLHSTNLQNLVNSTDIGTIFLDRGLRIKLFTPAARELFNLIPADYGRPLSDITHRLRNVDVLADAETVLEKLRTIEHEIHTTDERVYLLRVLPYRAGEDRIGGVVMTFFDITERKRAEEALRESEVKYRTLFDSIDEGFCIIELIQDQTGANVDYRFLEVNHAFERQTGIEQAAGKRGSELTLGTEIHWLESYDHVARTGEPQRFESYHDATGRWYQTYASRISGTNNQVAIVFDDITERKRHEANLALLAQVSENLVHFANLNETINSLCERIGKHFGAAVCAFSEVDEAAGTVVSRYVWHRADAVNPPGTFRIEDYHGEDVRQLMRSGKPEIVRDIASFPAAVAANMAALKIGAYVNTPLVRDGQWRVTLSITDTRPRDWREDEIELMLELTNRIWTQVERTRTEEALRESEGRFRLLVEGARDYAMFLLDPDNRITFWSSGAERVFGWSAAEALGQTGALIFTPEDRERGAVEREVRTAIEQGRAEDRRWHIRKDGSRLFVDGVLVRLDEAGGQLRGFVKIGRDATEQRMAEDALQQAHDELEQRVKERTAELERLSSTRQELLYRLVTAQEDERQRLARELHDSLGQYLSALTVRLSALEAQTEELPEVHDNLANLRQVASQIDAELDRLTMELRPPTLGDMGLVDALATYTHEWSATSGIPVDLVPIDMAETRLPTVIETTVYRIVQEALTNVLKHAHASQASVVLERRDATLHVVIADNGEGFEPGARSEVGVGGRHIGLLNMSERAALAGGELTIESAPDSGTTVMLRIPLSHDAPQHA